MEEILANIWETIAIVFKPITNIFSNVLWVFNSIWTLFNRFFNSLVSIIKFIIDLIKFIVYAFSTIVNYIYKAFVNIFWDWLGDTISSWYNNLSVYLGAVWTPILSSLVVVAFVLIVFGFVMRLIKWQTNYNTAVKRLEKSNKHK